MRTLHLHLKTAINANDEKGNLESLAFAVLLKSNFVSSTLKESSIRSIMRFLNVGYTRAKRIKDRALKLGYIRIKDGMIIANKIKLQGLNIKLTIKENLKINIKSVCEWIKQSIFINHIKKSNLASDTIKRASNPSSQKEFRKGRKDIKKYALKGNFDFCSYGRIAEVMKCDRNKAIKLTNKLVNNGIITKKTNKNLIYVGPDAVSFCKNYEHIHLSSVFYVKNKVYEVLSNSYKLVNDIVVYAR